MASAGPNNGATFTSDDTSGGTKVWSNPTNAGASDDAWVTTLFNGVPPIDWKVRIIKGGTVGATDKSSPDNWPETDAYTTYGSSTDLWGETWTSTDINATNFGFAIAASKDTAYSHYLNCQDFGFTIPAGQTINGIVVEVEKGHNGVKTARIDHVRITVYYTAAGATTPKMQTSKFWNPIL